MTAVKSTNKKNFFWTRYLNNLKGNSKNFIVNIILQILGLPVLSVLTIISFYYDNMENMTDAEIAVMEAVGAGCIPFAVIAILTLSASVLIGSIVALSQYKYLYQKTITDMNYSLPLSTTQRFFADYLSGFTIYIGVPVAAVALSLGILGIGSFITDLSELWNHMPFILSLVFIVIFAMVQYYTMAVFSLSFCGNTFESHFSILAFTVMIPATIGCLWGAIISSSTFGISGEAVLQSPLFIGTNPIGAAVFFFQYADNYMYDEITSIPMYLKWFGFTLLFTALYLGGAYLLQRFRKAEDVSKPYVYRSFFYAIMTMGTFCVLSLFIMSNVFIVAGIVICAVVWFIMEIITRRGFKKFWTAPVAFTAAVISVLGICWICDITDGFGISKRVPSAMNVNSVTVSIDNYSSENVSGIKFRDKDVIKEAVALNKEIVDRHFHPENYTYNEISVKYNDVLYSGDFDDIEIEFEYTTLTGSVVMREYKVNSGMTDKLTKAILLSDEYAEYNRIGTAYSYSDNKNKRSIRIDNKYRIDSRSYEVTSRQSDKIREAYIKDMKEMTEDELLEGKVCCFVDSRWILESFDDTISALESANISIPEVTKSDLSQSDIYIDADPKIYSRVQAYIDDEDYYYYKDSEGNSNLSLVDKITRNGNSYRYSYDDENTKTGINKKNVFELIQNSTPIIIGEMPIAIINIDGREFYLRNTPENAYILENADLSYSSRNSYYYDEYGWDSEELSYMK